MTEGRSPVDCRGDVSTHTHTILERNPRRSRCGHLFYLSSQEKSHPMMTEVYSTKGKKTDLCTASTVCVNSRDKSVVLLLTKPLFYHSVEQNSRGMSVCLLR